MLARTILMVAMFAISIPAFAQPAVADGRTLAQAKMGEYSCSTNKYPKWSRRSELIAEYVAAMCNTDFPYSVDDDKKLVTVCCTSK